MRSILSAALLSLAASSALATSVPGGLYKIPDANCSPAVIEVDSLCSLNTNCRIHWSPQSGFSLLTIDIREQGEGYNPFTPTTLNAVHSSDQTNPQQLAFTTANGTYSGGTFTATFHAVPWANMIAFDDAEYYANGNVDFPVSDGQFDILVTRMRGDRLNVRADYVCAGQGGSAYFLIQF